jgi:hypothetical protein
MDTSKVTRLEVINHGGEIDFVGRPESFGRVLISWATSVELELQDGGRTLKIFMGPKA